MMTGEGGVGFFEAMLMVFPALIISIIGGVGLIVLPLLFGFTIIFVRFDVHFAFLAVPAALAFFATYHFTSMWS